MKKEYDFRNGTRGAIQTATAGRTRITINIDADVLAWFRRRVNLVGGGNYPRLINAALRDHITGDRETLEETLKRVIRSELGDAIEEGFRQDRDYEQAFMRWRRGIRKARRAGVPEVCGKRTWIRDGLHERHPRKKAK
jgi:hypothetical protein